MKKILFLLSAALLLSVSQLVADFTIGVMPDTQILAWDEWNAKRDEKGARLMKEMAQFWVDHKEELNLIFVASLGDMVEEGGDREWQRVKDAYNIIEAAGIPFAPCQGNHDKAKELNKWFPIGDFRDTPTWGGSMNGGMENAYYLLEADGLEFILLVTEYDPDSPVLTWARNTFYDNSGRRGILATHHIYGEVRDQILKPSVNTFLAVQGHDTRLTGEDHWTVTAQNKNIIHCILSDYQGRRNNDGAIVRYYTFKPAENKIYAYTYDLVRKAYETDANSQFSWDYLMEEIETSVVLTSPANGAHYETGSPVPMSAETSLDIDDVLFWIDNGHDDPYVIITERVVPYKKTAFDLPDGVYTLWAEGIDLKGKGHLSDTISFTIGEVPTPTPSPTPEPITITLTSPVDGTVYTSGRSVPMYAEALPDKIDDVHFWITDGIHTPYVIIIERVYPFSKSAFDLADGTYTIWAEGIDFTGNGHTTEKVTITIGERSTPTPTPTPTPIPTPEPTAQPITITLTSPVDGAVYTSGSSVPMYAEASAEEIDNVYFWITDGTSEPYPIIIEWVYPFSKSALGLTDGSYTIWAEGIDFTGNSHLTPKVTITIGEGSTPTPTPTPTPGPAVNLLKNPGFEEGKVDWIGFESKTWLLSSIAQEGLRSARNIGGSDITLYQEVALKPNTDYQLSGWMRISAGSAGNLKIDTQDVFDQALGGDFINTKADNIWYYYEGSFNSGSVTSVRIRSYSIDFSGTGRIDNLFLREKQ